MTYTVDVTVSGSLPNISKMFFSYATPALNELLQIGEKAAKEDYLNKKKSIPKMPSMIIASFGYKIDKKKLTLVGIGILALLLLTGAISEETFIKLFTVIE